MVLAAEYWLFFSDMSVHLVIRPKTLDHALTC